MANESTQWLYGQLTKRGYNVGKDVEEFDSLMRSNAESRQWAYDTATKSGLNVGKDIDEFSSLVGGGSQAEVSPAPPAAVAPVEASAPAAGDEAVKEERWNPTMEERIENVRSVQDVVNHYRDVAKVGLDAAGRRGELYTPEGRERRKTQEFMARLSGTRVKPMGLVKPSGADADASGGGDSEGGSAPVVSPVPYGYVIGKDGKRHSQWLLPDGSLTTDFIEADKAEYVAREGRLQHEREREQSVEGQLRRAEAELAELRRQFDERGNEVLEESTEFDRTKMNGPLGFLLHGETNVRKQSGDKERSALRVAIRQKEEQIKNLREERDRQAGKDVGFWRGFGRTVSDTRTWDFGTGDLLDAMTVLNADAYSAPDATEGERRAGQAMMQALHDNQQVEEMYGGNASFWNRAGVMTGYMPSFMVDFALTGGGFEAINVVGKAAARGSVKLIGEAAVKEMSKLGVKAYAKKYGIRGVGRMAGNWTVKALGTTADDLLLRAPLMTNTIQGGKTAADVINRKLGAVVVDENGNYSFENDKTWGSAVWQGEADAVIENYSEMFGAHLDGVVPALAKAFGGKRISGMLARANASGYGRILATTREHFKRLGVSDYFGEVAEEYYGQLWRSMLKLDDAYTNVPVCDEDGNQVVDEQGNPVYERKNLLFTGEFNGDIWGGMALSMGLMGAGKYSISGAAYLSMKHQVNKADKRASEIFTSGRWDSIRELIDTTTNDDMGTLAESIVSDDSLTEDELSAVMVYMERSLNLRGLNLGALARSRESAADAEEASDAIPEAYYGDDVQGGAEIDSGLSQSYIEGYETSDPQRMNDAQNMYEYQRRRAEGFFDASFLEAFENNPVYYLQEMQRTGQFTQEEIDAAIDYINAKTVRDGILQRVHDNIDEQITQSDAMINARVNPASGMIHPAVMGLDNREVYVVGGSLAINPDGTIDREASDESIVVRDAQTGELQFTDPKSVVSAGEAIDPEMERAIAVDNIRQQTAQAAADALNGTLAFNPGDVVEINDGGGNVQVTVLGPVVDENSGMPVEGQVLVQFPNGQQTAFAKEQLQSFADAANIERIDRRAQENAAARGGVVSPGFALNDEFTVLKEDGTPVRGTITAELDEDGRIEIQTDEPVNGNYVNRFTPAELEAMFDTYNGQAVNMSAPEAVDTAAEAEAPQQPVAAEGEDVRQDESALSRVPVGADGKPDFGAADVDTAWDALVEKTGNESVASAFAANMVSVSEAELKKAEKMKPKATVDIDEFMAAENERLAAVERAKSALEHWKAVEGTKQRREAERLSAEAEEARRRASERAAEEARVRAEREEAERLEREALNGVPDWSVDTPQDARARGYRRNGPKKVDRQEIIDDHALGNSVEVKFGDDVIQSGNVVVMEASQLQPSHRDGQRNPAHFLDEAQPKERKDAASRLAAARIAEGIRPEEITSSVTAYTGAPSVNSRGEVIQGNNRSEALRMMYEGYPDSAAKYKRYLIEHAAEFGLTREAVEAFEHPVLVNMLDVSDESAIALGQYVAQDTESGGVERIKPKNAVQKMGDKIGTFANLLLRSADEEATFAQLVDANGVNVLKWMNRNGYITNTQYASAFDSKGNLTAEAANDLKGIMYQSVFRGGSTRLEEMFNNLPSKAQRAILATAFRDYDSAFADRMIGEIQQSVIAFNALMGYERFSDATNAESARQAVGEWVSQYAFDDVSGEPYLPSETFSNFALALAAMYKGNTQKHIQSVFNTMYDIIQGTEQDNLFEAADKTPRPVAEAIRQVLNLEYQPVKKNDNGTNGSAVLDINSEDVQGGRRGSNGNADGAEQHKEDAEPGYGADNWDDVLPERATAETESSHVDVFIDQARGGDAAAIADLERYGIEAGTPGVYRFAGKGEVDSLMAGKHYRGRMGNGRVDVTASEEVTSAAHKDYRIKFKAEFDLYKKGNGRTQMKSAQEKDGYVLGGYDLRDVESIEELQPDGSYREIYRATESATEAEVNTEPTEAQKAAGNYKKGHVRVDGHNVSIENPKGSVRRGTDADGNEWENTMQNDYGYIRGTQGVDGDHIDVFLSDTPEEGDVFVIDQVNEDGSFDEHKVMYGFPTEQAARDAYLSNYKSGWNGLGAITRVSKEEFKKWIQSSKRKTKPFAEYKSVRDITYNVDQTPTNVNEQGMIVDGEGKPLTLYHGTPNDVELADLAMGHTRQGDDEAARYNGDGISFTPNRDVANDYATTNGGEGKVFEVNVTLKKPYYTLGIANFTPEEAAEFTASLQAKGHDGIINYQSKAMREAGAIPNEVIVFDVNSVTPATGVAPANVSSEQPSQGNKADGIASNQSVINSDGKVSDSAADKQTDGSESSDFERGLADFARRYGEGKERVSVLDREFSEWMSGRSVKELADLDVNMLNAVCNAAGLDAGKAWAFRMSIDKATPKEKLSEVFELRGQRKAGEMKGNEEAEGDVQFHAESSGNSRDNSEVYEAAKGLLESAGIEVIEVDNATAQEKLGGLDDVRLMGSRTDRKMSQVGEYYSGKELDGNQQSVVDVFSGKEDNVAVDVERAEGTARVVMRQGTENRAGAKHSLFRHFGTRAAWVTEADIAMIPEIIGKGERSVKGNSVTYDYETADGTRLRVTTINNRGREEFTNFLSNRKPLSSESRQAQKGNTQSSARATNAEVSDAKLGNNSESGKSDDSVRVLRTSGGVAYGWTEGGKVYLNRDAMNPETPLHEYTHLWDDMVRRENPELWARGKELMKQTPLWDEVVNDPAYADIRDDEDAVASEVHSRLTGKRGAEVMQEMINRAKAKGAMETAEAVSLVERLKRWLGDMFRGLRATLGKWSKKELDGLTLEDFNNMTLRDLAEGVNPKSGEKNLVAVHNISEENLVKALDLGGFPMPSIAITKAGTGHTGFGEISLVFGKESVNPADRRNKVYSGDAWTPTFPETGYKLNEAKTARIYDRANNAGRLPFLRAVDFHPDNYGRKISDDRRSLMDAFREDYGAKQLFLSEHGNAVESFETREVEKYTAEETGLFEKMLEQIGVERLRNESVEELFAELSQLIGAHTGTDLSSKKPFVAASIVKNAVRKALDYADTGNLKTEKDLEATRAKIDERLNPDEYEAWLEEMFADIVEKKGIRNERDMFTPSGESRRWESLYDAVTLDNVVKAMRRQADKGGTGFFGGSIFGAAHRELKNMEDIRREAAARIRSVSDEEIETAKKRVEERLGSISLPSVEGNFSATMDFVENVREAVVKSHTAEGIYRYLSDIYPDMTMEVAKEISDIVGEIQQMSTRYLEAKPQRAVTPEEVRLAVVPEGTPAEIVKRLESHGIAVRTYERGNEHERNAIISRETSERDLRFHAAMSRGRGDFDALRERAVSERGIVMPGLNEAEVRVVEVPRHDFAGTGKEALQAAEKWGKENITGMHTAFDSEGNAFEYSISNDAVEKYVSRSATAKSENIGVHLAVLKKLPEVISESIEAEIHPDYKKFGGKRAASGEINAESLVHRFYGAVIIEDKSYRVKTTMREFSDENMSTVAHSYEVTEIELLEAPSDNTIGTAEPLAMTSNSSIPAAKLLQGVEKSYDPGKKLLDESEIAYREDNLTNSGAGGTGVRDIRREGDTLDRQAEGLGVSVSEVRDKNRFGGERQAEFAARERERMVKRVEELAERMHLDNVEIVTDASQLEGKRAKAKGFYNKRTGKITVVIPNNVSMIDAEQTLLHEAVAHYGLRQLFGEQFNTFLDNVYESADASIRRKIAEMAAKNGWDFRTATEEYLAGLAEDTDFSEARRHAGWWTNIKRLFLDMLDKIGFKGFRDKTGVVLTDNELRYILWRSYENLAESGRSRGILGEAADVAKQNELKVGNFAEHGIEAEYAAEVTDIGEISERFNNELVQYEESTLPQGHRFELGMPSRYLQSAGFPNLPICMRASLLARKAGDEKHPFEASDIKGLVDAIQKPIAIFEYTKANMRNLIVDVKRGDKHFLVGVTLNYKAGDIEINSVSGLFPKESHEWVKWIQDGKAVRIDQKEKVQTIIDSLRTNPAESERIGLNLEDVAKIVENFENPTIEEEELFRPGDFTPRDRAIARDAYNRICASGGYQFKEALQDSMLGLKELYKAILGKETRIEDVAGFENAYLFENRMNSATKGQQHVYFIRYMQPLLKEIGRIAGANERKRRELTDYIMAKHGLERNEYMRREAAANGEKTERDFAGLTGWRNVIYCGKSSKGGKPISFRRVFTFSGSSSLQSTNSFVVGSFCTF
ncbi:MAG: hypothetical protein K2I69_09440 [Muribaculaceae bacterium]|nr:hypothetical protein [Muribaculaceae bacterium]